MSAAVDSSDMLRPGRRAAELQRVDRDARPAAAPRSIILEEHSGLRAGGTHRGAGPRARLSRAHARRADAARAGLRPAASAEATRRRCLLARSGGKLLAVIADPFDAEHAQLAGSARAAGARVGAGAARRDRQLHRPPRASRCARWTPPWSAAARKARQTMPGSTICRWPRSARTPVRSSSWCTRPCTTRCAPARATSTSRRSPTAWWCATASTACWCRWPPSPARRWPSRSSRASRSWRSSTSPSAACRRTAASRSRSTVAPSTFASRSCPASSARTRCCAYSTSRR